MAKKTPARGRSTPAPASHDDIDDLIGEVPALVTPPTDAVHKPKIEEVHYGVTMTWLCQAFGMDRQTVKKRLVRCPVLRHENDNALYDLKMAAGFLVKPVMDVDTYIKQMRPNDLPSFLQAAYWDAQLKRQKWEENAKLLWRTEDVLAVFGELAITLRSTIQLWVEDQDRVSGLTPKMREHMTQQSDDLLATIHKIMVEQPLKRSTQSTITQLDEPAEDPDAVL